MRKKMKSVKENLQMMKGNKMKKNELKAALCAALVAIAGSNAMAQTQNQQTEQPQGKVILTTFSSLNATFTDEDGAKNNAAFDLERAYLGYDYHFNSHWNAKVVYDMGKGDDAKLQRLGYVKNAFVSYHNGGLKVEAGLTGTKSFAAQEKAWGYRYVYKSFMDENKWGSSADLGVMAEYQMTDWMSADLSCFNGEGYKKVQADNNFLYGLGLTLKPAKGLQLRAYAETQASDDSAAKNQTTLAFSCAYQQEHFSLGAEYDLMINQGNVDGRHLQGFSAYATGHLSEVVDLYGRYDYGTSSNDNDNNWNYAQDGQTAILGVQCKLNKLVSLSPNFRVNFGRKDDINTYFAFLSAKVSL